MKIEFGQCSNCAFWKVNNSMDSNQKTGACLKLDTTARGEQSDGLAKIQVPESCRDAGSYLETSEFFGCIRFRERQ